MNKIGTVVLKILLSLLIIGIFCFIGFWQFIILSSLGTIHIALCVLSVLIMPSVFLLLIWVKDRKTMIKYWGIFAFISVIAIVSNFFIDSYEKSLEIDTTPNIPVNEYMPFDSDSKIVCLPKESKTKISGKLPVIDSASAVFPLCSAFVNAVYPENKDIFFDGILNCNGTSGGYYALAQKETDIFLGSYPSEEQINFAKEMNTEFVYTPIGKEAFVFFVHKDNPIDGLTKEQIQAIYSGEITNWKELGGYNKNILAFQRNEGSGSQTRLIRFMEGKKLAEPPSELRNGLMTGIIEEVSNYQSKPGAIGFSFRYYVEEIIKNPDIKILAVDGVYPNVETIKNGTYPLSGELYAVTYLDNDNPNVNLLIDWILSEEGQYLIEKTGYVGIK